MYIVYDMNQRALWKGRQTFSDQVQISAIVAMQQTMEAFASYVPLVDHKSVLVATIKDAGAACRTPQLLAVGRVQRNLFFIRAALCVASTLFLSSQAQCSPTMTLEVTFRKVGLTRAPFVWKIQGKTKLFLTIAITGSTGA